ncbi:MAG TPA: hypothetical protein DGT23_14735 [Micromonosporaceae bacterium]|nr:hypothetical protein [Micromonosporaceae bacterium]
MRIGRDVDDGHLRQVVERVPCQRWQEGTFVIDHLSVGCDEIPVDGAAANELAPDLRFDRLRERVLLVEDHADAQAARIGLSLTGADRGHVVLVCPQDRATGTVVVFELPALRAQAHPVAGQGGG